MSSFAGRDPGPLPRADHGGAFGASRVRPNGAEIHQPRATPWVDMRRRFPRPEGTGLGVGMPARRNGVMRLCPFRARGWGESGFLGRLPGAGDSVHLRCSMCLPGREDSAGGGENAAMPHAGPPNPIGPTRHFHISPPESPAPWVPGPGPEGSGKIPLKKVLRSRAHLLNCPSAFGTEREYNLGEFARHCSLWLHNGFGFG